MEKKYIMALDEGTSSVRCILFDKAGNIKSMSQRGFKQIYPQPGWVEHDATEIWARQIGVAREAMEKIGAKAEEIAGIGITDQRETTVVWDRATGQPICNAIVWQCRRTAEYCDSLAAAGWSDKIREKTGLLIDAYFSGTKLRWILENVPGARERAEKGELLFGTIDSWLIWKLTGGKVHVTDYSNASRTMMFNIHTLEWDEEILELLGIPRCMLPKPVQSSQIYGDTDPAIFGGPIPVSGAAGDQQCALFGQTCFKPGEVKNTYGTGGFLLMNTGDAPVSSQNGLVTTIAWGLDGKVTYALEGSIFVAGAAIQWLRDEMDFFEHSAQVSELASRVPDTGGVFMVPAFVGLGAPYWDPYARGIITGITRGTNRDHIARAVLESMAYQTCDVLKAMEQDSGISLSALKVDGGASANNMLLQIQADMINRPVVRPSCIETTALGAAYLAGLSTGFWESLEEVEQNWKVDREFSGGISDEDRRSALDGWHHAVRQAMAK